MLNSGDIVAALNLGDVVIDTKLPGDAGNITWARNASASPFNAGAILNDRTRTFHTASNNGSRTARALE